MLNTKILVILDGWGYSESTQHNAIHAANTPCWDKLIKEYPNTLLSCSGSSVGLPSGQIGNSEVGHMTMGAGRVIFQDLARINLAIEQQSFYSNEELIDAINYCKENNKNLHILGLLSNGGVHSHENHLFALIKLCAKQAFANVKIHAFLDGRDTAPQSAKESILKLENLLEELKIGKIASISGRYYAMDRDKRYDRTSKTYDLLTDKDNKRIEFSTAIEALENSYSNNITDEFLLPTAINFDKENIIQDDDVVIFYNFRADRAKQLSFALSDKNFSGFDRKIFPKIHELLTFTEYSNELKSKIIFPKPSISNTLGEVLEQNNLTQLRIAETEKYAHVTFFFNGGTEEKYKFEDRILVPSLKIATYDLQPEMSAIDVSSKLVQAIKSNKYNFILCNFANADMVGHTGNFNATIKAIETLDKCLANIYEAIVSTNSEMIITADHGNAEVMFNDGNQQPHTAHSNNLVPCIFVSNKNLITNKHKIFGLQDIAPTILNLMGIQKPTEMDGEPIFTYE